MTNTNTDTHDDSTHKDVHPDHKGRDTHGNIADPDLPENEARSGRKAYSRFVLGKSMILILVLLPLAVIAAYFLTR